MDSIPAHIDPVTNAPVPESYVHVVLDTKSILPYDTLTYRVGEEIGDIPLVGKRVVVPFRNSRIEGFVMGTGSDPVPNVRDIERVVDGVPPLDDWQRELATFISRRYVASLSEVVKTMIPSPVRKGKGAGKQKTKEVPPVPAEECRLNESQQVARDTIVATMRSHNPGHFLLHGVTGSGKTEVYLSVIADALERGLQAIVLVPEIALTPQSVDRFSARFPGRIAVLHSALTEPERARQWWTIKRGEADIVIGSRSALFAPLPRLGVIVVDEEDSSSYKQDRHPRYHAVETALELGTVRNAAVVLGSATPRVEMFYRAHTGDLTLLSLDHRFNGRDLPDVEVVDLRDELAAGNRSMLSNRLADALAECHESGGQSLLFLNRRGLATTVLCRSCGFVQECDQCSSHLVYHFQTKKCHCHYCGKTSPLVTVCPQCSSTTIRQIGGGTERVEQEMKDRFPSLRILRMDRDTMQHANAHEETFRQFERREADCLIGTQMITKGWDLAGVRLVGIINADGALHFPDYRSAETTFSLITQVAGRTGRGTEPAKVILQTYTPEHYAIQAASRHDYAAFAHREIRIRKQWSFPPFREMVVCQVTHAKDEKAKALADEAVTRISATITPDAGIDILGPSPAMMHQVKGEFRWEFILRGNDLGSIYPVLPKGAMWNIDVDPAL